MRLRTELVQAAAGRARHLGNLTEGRLRALRPATAPANAQTLMDKVRSEVLGRPEWRGPRINVSACDGVITLNGQLDDRARIARLVEQVRRVDGVRDVESSLHVPGTPAPNKVAALTAGPT